MIANNFNKKSDARRTVFILGLPLGINRIIHPLFKEGVCECFMPKAGCQIARLEIP
jgi:hypothetical protein